MSEAKQKFTQKFPKKELFSYQNWLDLWSKEAIDNFVNNFIKVQDETTKFVKTEFSSKTKQFSDIYFAQKAVNNNANDNLPLKTLVLLGKKLNQSAYREDIKKIIDENIIKFKGEFYKLDDHDSQLKIQKAIKNYQFEECSPLNKVA